MTLVKNIYGHPYTPTIGHVMAPGDVADIGLYVQELDAIATGYMIVMDPSWVPPDEPPLPPVSGQWRGTVADVADLPASGNVVGDAFAIPGDSIYVWDGDSWEVMLSGGGGGGGGDAFIVQDPDTGYPARGADSTPKFWIGWDDPTELMAELDLFVPIPAPS
jgi:hypothetical protein